MKEQGKKLGRPRVPIEEDQLRKLCELGCTLVEIAGFFDCSEDTVERRVREWHEIGFAEYSRQKRGVGNIALRRAQMKAALAGDKTMLVWLGKNRLKQTDAVDHRHSGAVDHRHQHGLSDNLASDLRAKLLGITNTGAKDDDE